MQTEIERASWLIEQVKKKFGLINKELKVMDYELFHDIDLIELHNCVERLIIQDVNTKIIYMLKIRFTDKLKHGEKVISDGNVYFEKVGL